MDIVKEKRSKTIEEEHKSDQEFDNSESHFIEEEEEPRPLEKPALWQAKPKERHNFGTKKEEKKVPVKNSLFQKGKLEVQDDEMKDMMLLEEEKVLYNHLECVKQEAQLITVEGEIITKLENALSEGDQYDMQEYLNTAEQIAEQKLKMYAALMENIKGFRRKFC